VRYWTQSLIAVLSLTIVACDSVASETEGPSWLRARITASIGADESAGDEYLFGAISSVAADAQGRIYVADMLASEIRVFDQAGTFIQTIGRQGRGPGEFQNPFSLLIADDELWVADGVRISQLVASEPRLIPNSPGQIRRFTGAPNTALRRARIVEGHYYAPSYFYPFEGGSHYFYLVISEEAVVDTVPVPALSNLDRVRGTAYRGRGADTEQRRIINSLDRAPFEPIAVWDLTNRGTVIAGSGQIPLQEFDATGGVLRTFELPVTPRAVSAAERNDSTAALAGRLQSLTIPLDQIEGVSALIRDGSLPSAVPAYIGVFVAADDRVWVRTWPPAEDPHRTDFVVFSPAGQVEALVTIPIDLSADVPPHFDGGLIIGVTRNRDTGVQSVVAASVQLPG
jgi:hypothetical protein